MLAVKVGPPAHADTVRAKGSGTGGISCLTQVPRKQRLEGEDPAELKACALSQSPWLEISGKSTALCLPFLILKRVKE